MSIKKIIFNLLILNSLVYARDVIEKSDECLINWTQGYIDCTATSAQGQVKYAANISAKTIARRDMLGVIKGIQIDSDTIVNDGLLASDIIHARVQGSIKGCQILNVHYDAQTQSSTATARIMMGKDLLSALMSDPTELSFNEKVKHFFQAINPINSLNAAIYSPSEKETILKLIEDMKSMQNTQALKHLKNVLQNIDNTTYSGILIDVSALTNFQKAMVVRLVDKEGNEVYPGRHLSKEVLTKRNTSVGYIFGLEDARKNTRVFSIPLEIKVNDVYKNKRSNIILNDAQIKMINELDTKILADAKIILVLED